MKVPIMFLAAILALGACATSVAVSPQPRQIVAEALQQPPPALEARAEQGDARAQLAWSLVLGSGLKGVPRDPAAAGAWRAKATAQRGFTSVVAYSAPFRGHAGRVNVVPVPRRDVSLLDAQLVDRCAEALDAEAASPAQRMACGGDADYAQLLALWRAARDR